MKFTDFAMGVWLTCTFVLSPMARADTVLSPGSAWEYTFTNPTGDSTWNTTTGIGGIWASGPAPFGNRTGGFGPDPTGLFDFATFWPASSSFGDDLWVRASVDLTTFDLTSLAWDLGVDNGFKLYVNGILIASANAEGYTFRWEYVGNFTGATLNQGINIIAVALEDHGGLTAFDMQITGTPRPLLEATIGINPDTLNVNSHGKWVTVVISLPEGFDVADIDVTTIKIGSLAGNSCASGYTQWADLSFTPEVGDSDEDAIPDLTVKFDRQVLIANLCLDDVGITIVGELTTGDTFEGSDSIRVIQRGK